MLYIFEELFLFALDEERGNVYSFAKKTLAHGLAGGILAELALQGKIRSNEKRRMEVVDDGETGDVILDEALKEIRSSEKPRKTAYWISQMSARPKNLRQRIGERLVEKQLLYQEDGRFFWRQASQDESLQRVSTKFEMKYPLRAAIFLNESINLHNLALLNVASAAGLFNFFFTQDELQIARNNLHEKIVRVALDNPVMQTIEEIEQAILTSLEDDLD